MLEKMPTRIKFTALVGVLLIGPAMVASVVFGGPTAMLVTGMVFVFIFMVFYFIVVRNYL